MAGRDDDELKQAFRRYVICGGGFDLISELSGQTYSGKPDGWANHPDVGLVQVVLYPSGFEGAWSWNRFTQQPIYMGKAPKRAAKPEQKAITQASAPQFPALLANPAKQEDEIIIIRRPSSGLLKALFGRE